MAVPTSAQISQFSVKKNGTDVSISKISRIGRLNDILVIDLTESVFMGDNITVSYSKGTVTDVNGGMLNSFSDKAVTNYVRATPSLVNAYTRKDGEGIILEFDQYIDPSTLIAEDFTVNATNEYQVEEVILSGGVIDENISNKITLVLDETIYNTDIIDVSYTKGSMTALYGAAAQSFSGFPVENMVDSNRITLRLMVYDGSSSLDGVAVKGDMKSRPFILYDDGTNGDEVAGDDIWTKSLQLIDGSYNWEVYSRITTVTYDTTYIIDEGTGVVTIILEPTESYKDSLISGTEVFSFNVDFENKIVTGDTIFNYRSNSVVFILDMKKYLSENSEQEVKPYVMGIKGDWLNGIPMAQRDSLNPDSVYYAIAKGYNIGEVINFNFRNGDTWENATSKSRMDTIAGNDTVYAVFGVTGSSAKITETGNFLSIFPNPLTSNILEVSFSGQLSVDKIVIFNLYGQQMMHVGKPSESIDLSGLPEGIYMIAVTDNNGRIHCSQLIRQ
jgi:hypothetical protein